MIELGRIVRIGPCKVQGSTDQSRIIELGDTREFAAPWTVRGSCDQDPTVR